jgi:hypothetical protein
LRGKGDAGSSGDVGIFDVERGGGGVVEDAWYSFSLTFFSVKVLKVVN